MEPRAITPGPPGTQLGGMHGAVISPTRAAGMFPTRTVGQPPMEYLLAWRMAVAKKLLRQKHVGAAEVAERVGYGSASAFSTAFARYVGCPPGRYAREYDTRTR